MRAAVQAAHGFSGAVMTFAKLKILDPVVRAIAVDVVDGFVTLKRSPEVLLHYDPMFERALPAGRLNVDVSLPV